MTTTSDPQWVTTKHIGVGDQVADAKGGRPTNGPAAFDTVSAIERDRSRVTITLAGGRVRQFGPATKLFRIPATPEAAPAPKVKVSVPPITRAARRDLLKAHGNGGVLGGLCQGPMESLVAHGLAAAEPATGGFTIALTTAGKALAEHLASKGITAAAAERLAADQDKANKAKAEARAKARHPHGRAHLAVVPEPTPEPTPEAEPEATPVTKPVDPTSPGPAPEPSKRLTEDEVVQWINRTRQSDPAASWVKMTKAIRATGRSCSNARFRRILATIEAPKVANG